jgi:ABC-type transport system substrate-binding protein
MTPGKYRGGAARPLVFALVALLLAACGGTPAAPEVVRETVVPAAPAATAVPAATEAAASPEAGATTEAAASPEAQASPEGAQTPEAAAAGSFTTPHPILGDQKVRQALAYCTDRLSLLQSVYPYLETDEREALLINSNLPEGHWALAPNLPRYDFDPEQANALLEEAGWTLPAGAQLGSGGIREKDGRPLTLDFLAGDVPFVQTWATVLEKTLLDSCGIQLQRNHVPGSFLFGDTTGITVRDFELAAYSWVGEPDPKGTTLYACNQIPLPENNWEGQNVMGWCNETASRAIRAANNTLDREQRIEQFGAFQREFMNDMVSIPLFQRFSVEAASTNVEGFRSDPTEYITANADEWRLKDGGDTMIISISSEPDTLFGLVAAFASTAMIGYLTSIQSATTYNYDYQAEALTQLPTIESGAATNETVEVSEGDLVWNADGERVELAPGVTVTNADGESVTYESGTVPMKKLAVTFEYVEGIRWEDGEPLKAADFELANRITCDPESGATSYSLCESRESVEVLNDRSYKITYLPGAQWPEYFVYGIGAFPSHQVLADGRRLADVPAAEWATLPEVAERPLSTGPYRIVEWVKGQRIELEANPYYYKGEVPIKNLTVLFIPDSTQAVAQLLTGEVDLLEQGSIGADAQTVIEAGRQGQIQVTSFPSPTWSHIDMNLFVR